LLYFGVLLGFLGAWAHTTPSRPSVAAFALIVAVLFAIREVCQ